MEPTLQMKIGLGSTKHDYNRVRAVRQAIGGDVKLMVDANRGTDPKRQTSSSNY
jgi:L-alanine-DL-glutamate epimerase-like enolase superfamily enzyme